MFWKNFSSVTISREHLRIQSFCIQQAYLIDLHKSMKLV